jgi:hypothetical protein
LTTELYFQCVFIEHKQYLQYFDLYTVNFKVKTPLLLASSQGPVL